MAPIIIEKELIDRIKNDIAAAVGSTSLETRTIVMAANAHLVKGGASPDFVKTLEEYRTKLLQNCEDITSRRYAQLIKSAQRRVEGIYFLDDAWGKLLNVWIRDNPQKYALVEALDDVLRSMPDSKPNAAWKSSVASLFERFSTVAVQSLLREWLGMLADSSEASARGISFPSEDQLKGMIFILAMAGCDGDSLLLRRLAERCYRKVSGLGPLSLTAGNQCVQALASTTGREGLEALTELSATIRYPKNAIATVKKALEKAASELGVAVKELEDASVPTYGLTD